MSKENKSVLVSVRVTPQERQAYHEAAAKLGTEVSDYVRAALHDLAERARTQE